MTYTIKMTFRTDENKLHSITVPRADSQIADASVAAAMAAMIGLGIVQTAKGNLSAV